MLSFPKQQKEKTRSNFFSCFHCHSSWCCLSKIKGEVELFSDWSGASLGSFHYSVRFSPWTNSDSSRGGCGHRILPTLTPLLSNPLLLSSQDAYRQRRVRKKAEDDDLLGTERWCLSIHIRILLDGGRRTKELLWVPSPDAETERRSDTQRQLRRGSNLLAFFFPFSYLYYPCPLTLPTQTLQRRKVRVLEIKVYEGHSQEQQSSALLPSLSPSLSFL